MAVPTNTVTAFAAIGNREDLSDMIYNIDPSDTPFLSALKKVKASNPIHEWQTDSLRAGAANRKIEGDDVTASAFVPTVRLRNYCQLQTEGVSVSDTQSAANPAGRGGEFSYQVAKKMKELKLDMEFALVQNQASNDGGAGTGRASAGVESWLTTYTSVGSGTAQTTPGYVAGVVAAPTDSTITGAFTEASLKTVLANIYVNGGKPDTIMVPPGVKQTFSGFTGRVDVVNGGDVNKLVASVDVYQSDFGTLKIVPNREMRAKTALILDFDYLALATYRPVTVKPLARTGDAEKAYMSTEFCLQVSNQKASGKITDIS